MGGGAGPASGVRMRLLICTSGRAGARAGGRAGDTSGLIVIIAHASVNGAATEDAQAARASGRSIFRRRRRRRRW